MEQREDKVNKEIKKARPIHATKRYGSPHPFKAETVCNRLVRFGGIECEDRPVTCKHCLKAIKDQNNEQI